MSTSGSSNMIYKHVDPGYIDEQDTIALDVKGFNWEKAISIVEKPTAAYAAYSLLMFRGVGRPTHIIYSDFLSSLNTKECKIQDDTLIKHCEGIYILYSRNLPNNVMKERLDTVINDSAVNVDVNIDSAKEAFEELFTEEKRGIYIRDISQVPDGYTFLLGSVRSYLNQPDNLQKKLLGVHSPMLYIGLKGSHTALHIEDQNLCSLNYLLEGEPKVWLVVDRKIRGELTAMFKKYMNKYFGSKNVCPQALEHKIYTISPQLLKEWAIPYKIVIQKPGDLFFIRSGTYHTVVNMGRNTAEAVNVGSDLWNSSYDSPVCTCGDNKRKHVPQNKAIVYTMKKSASLHECNEKKCNKAFKTAKLLKKHKKLVHDYSDSFTCAECSLTYTKKSNLARHLKTHSREKKQKCATCNKYVRNVQAHFTNVHSSERPTCPKCGKKVRKCNFDRHVEGCKKDCPFAEQSVVVPDI